jgi:spore photoproduct lyase
MITIIYVEDDIRDHPQTLKILSRFNNVTVIPCQRYTEIFNRKSQNFRLQKQQPALILAKKHHGFVMDAPDTYGIEDGKNYYFSHMLNCIYDCRYCFLQGMYRSAHYVLFVNYEDFTTEIEKKIDENAGENTGEKTWFYSGYDCDSLALDPVTGFGSFILNFFKNHPSAHLEFRTKSTQVRSLLKSVPIENCVVAFSLSPENITQTLEAKTPSLDSRLEAMKKLQNSGWQVGIRFEPLIYTDDFKSNYENLFSHVFSALDTNSLHSVSVGAFRVPKAFFKNMTKLYPDEKLFAGPLVESEGMVSYRHQLQEDMLDWCNQKIADHAPASHIYQCR